MTKLSKQQIKDRDAAASALRDRKDDLEKAIENFNALVAKAWDEMTATTVAAYNEAIDTANTWRQEIVGVIDEYVSERSEKWQESDKASEYEAWKNVFEEETEQIELTAPKPVELDVEDAADVLEQLQEEVGG